MNRNCFEHDRTQSLLQLPAAMQLQGCCAGAWVLVSFAFYYRLMMLPSRRGILSVTKEKDWLESGAPRLEIKQVGGVIPNLLIGGIDKGGTTEAWHMSNQLFLTQTRKEPGCLYQIPLGLAAVKLCYKNLWDSLQPMPNSSKRVLHLDATPSYLYSLVNFN